MESVISLSPDEDDRAVIDAVLPLLQDSFSRAAIAVDSARVPDGFWTQVSELGWLTAGLDEASGGFGFDLTQEMLMAREFGRFVAPIALIAGIVGLRVFARSGVGMPAEVLSGKARIGFATLLSEGSIGPVPTGQVYLLDAEADYFVLADECGAAVVARGAVGTVKMLDSLDPTVRLGQARLSGQPAAAWLASVDEPISARMELLVAAELTGVALAASDQAAEYARTRVQFGKPIGAFQAVAHMCVDSFVRARTADAALALAAVALRGEWEDAPERVVSAAHVAGEAAMIAATNNVQVHGGMGYSAESGAHLYLKRTVLLRRLRPLASHEAALLLSRKVQPAGEPPSS